MIDGFGSSSSSQKPSEEEKAFSDLDMEVIEDILESEGEAEADASDPKMINLLSQQNKP